jgi:hypothetical protein
MVVRVVKKLPALLSWGESVGALRNVADEVVKFHAMICRFTINFYIFD